MEIESRVRGDVELDDLKYHEIVRDRIEKEIEVWRDKLESCTDSYLAHAQGMVAALRFMLRLPQQIVQEERAHKPLEVEWPEPRHTRP